VKQGDHTTTLGGLRAWFKVRGDGPVCLLPTPGWGASSDIYFSTLQRLERTMTMVYLDTRGSGRSERPSSQEGYRLEHFISDLDELRAHLGEAKVWIMGHSLGGLLAQLFALDYPGSCQGLILLNSTAAIDGEAEADIDMRMNRRKDEPWFPEAEAASHNEDISTDTEFKEHLRQIFPFYFHDVSKMRSVDEAFQAETFSIAAYAIMTLNQAELQKGALDRLADIQVPTVILVGDDDFICSPVQALRIHLRIPGSKLVVIEQAGHFPWIEQPDAFFRELGSALHYVSSGRAKPQSDRPQEEQTPVTLPVGSPTHENAGATEPRRLPDE
jgi:proline iminopeptidase